MVCDRDDGASSTTAVRRRRFIINGDDDRNVEEAEKRVWDLEREDEDKREKNGIWRFLGKKKGVILAF